MDIFAHISLCLRRIVLSSAFFMFRVEIIGHGFYNLRVEMVLFDLFLRSFPRRCFFSSIVLLSIQILPTINT